MADDHERVGWLLRGEERAHPPAEGAADERERPRVRRPERVARGAQRGDLLAVGGARSRPRGQRDGASGDGDGLEPLRDRDEDGLALGAAVAGDQQRAAAGQVGRDLTRSPRGA